MQCRRAGIDRTGVSRPNGLSKPVFELVRPGCGRQPAAFKDFANVPQFISAAINPRKRYSNPLFTLATLRFEFQYFGLSFRSPARSSSASICLR